MIITFASFMNIHPHFLFQKTIFHFHYFIPNQLPQRTSFMRSTLTKILLAGGYLIQKCNTSPPVTSFLWQICTLHRKCTSPSSQASFSAYIHGKHAGLCHATIWNLVVHQGIPSPPVEEFAVHLQYQLSIRHMSMEKHYYKKRKRQRFFDL